MKPEISSAQPATHVDNKRYIDNELDLGGLCCVLWAGKMVIMGVGLLFAIIALGYSFLVQQEWRSTAITDKPTIDMLGGYYQQQQLLSSLDKSATSQVITPLADMIREKAYAEFTVQLDSYDTRREFWLQSDYYKQRQTGNAVADAALLEDLIYQINYKMRDDKKMMYGNITLVAETANDAKELLRQYIAFANQQAVDQLNSELANTWQMWLNIGQEQLKQQTAIAQQNWQREIKNLQQGLAIARQRGITQSQLSGNQSMDSLSESEWFLLGSTMLQTRLEALEAAGPRLGTDYEYQQELLAQLKTGPILKDNILTYRYLRTPEEPITRDSPRRLFLVILCGSIGVMLGAAFILGSRAVRNTL